MTGSELFDESMRRAEANENAALRARVAAAEDRCDEHVAHVVEIGDVLDAEDGETTLEAAKRTMRKLEAATNLIAHTAARVAELEQQAAALADALESLRNEDNCWCDGPEKDRRGETDITTHYIYCSEIRDALRAAGRKT